MVYINPLSTIIHITCFSALADPVIPASADVREIFRIRVVINTSMIQSVS
jgi:hypothetical protein